MGYKCRNTSASQLFLFIIFVTEQINVTVNLRKLLNGHRLNNLLVFFVTLIIKHR